MTHKFHEINEHCSKDKIGWSWRISGKLDIKVEVKLHVIIKSPKPILVPTTKIMENLLHNHDNTLII